jgi:hypothetical protein
MDSLRPIAELAAFELLERAAKYRRTAAIAISENVRDALVLLAKQCEEMARPRESAPPKG